MGVRVKTAVTVQLDRMVSVTVRASATTAKTLRAVLAAAFVPTTGNTVIVFKYLVHDCELSERLGCARSLPCLNWLPPFRNGSTRFTIDRRYGPIDSKWPLQ